MTIRLVAAASAGLHWPPSMPFGCVGAQLNRPARQSFCRHRPISGSAGGCKPGNNKELIHVTPAAEAQFRLLTRNREAGLIRIYTKKGGCAGDSYQLDYVSKPEKLDEVVEINGISIIIDGKALFKVIGCEIDYVTTPLRSEFIFRNPNAKEVCGCGHSFRV